MYVYDIIDDITEKNMVILTPSMIFFLNQTKLNRKQIACLMFCLKSKHRVTNLITLQKSYIILFELFVNKFLKV